EDLTLHVDGDLLRQVALRNGGRHFGNVTHLARKVAGHEVHAVRQVGPGAGDAFHLRLPAELAFRADFTGHAGHFTSEGVELVHLRVDRVSELEDLALHVDGDLLRQIAASDGGGHFGDVADLAGQVLGH